MRDVRLIDISLYYYLKDSLESDGYTVHTKLSDEHVSSGIYLVDAYPDKTQYIKTPLIALDFTGISREPFQLGPGYTDYIDYDIYIFGRTKGERDDLGFLVLTYFDGAKIPIYDYNLYFASGGDLQLLGYIWPEITRLNVFETAPIHENIEFVNRLFVSSRLDVSSGYSLLH